jgi:hypothetical protein
MGNKSYKQVSTVDTLHTSLRQYLIGGTLKEDTIVQAIKRVISANDNDKNRFFELMCKMPTDTMDTDIVNERSYAQKCSTFQLLCNVKKKAIIECVFEIFDELLATTESPFEEHPLDMITVTEPTYNNTILHFICSDSSLTSIMPEIPKPVSVEESDNEEMTSEPVEKPKPNQTGAKAALTYLFKHDNINNKDLFNQVNKNGDTPVHLSCMFSMQSLWPDMVRFGAKMDTPNKNGILPYDLIPLPITQKAFMKALGGSQQTKKAEPVKKVEQKNTKKTATKRKIQDVEADEEEETIDPVAEPPRTRSRTKK